MTGPSAAGMPIADRGYQFRFLLRLSLIFGGGAVLLFLGMFLVFSQPFSGDYAGVFYALRHLAAFLLPIIAFATLVYVLLVCVATAILCIYAIHKVAGPLYRMERVLESYIAGDPVKTVFFRQGDQLPALAAAFNAFADRLRKERQECLGLMEHAERLRLRDEAECRAGMRNALVEMETLLAKYR